VLQSINGHDLPGDGKWYQRETQWQGLYWAVEAGEPNLGDQGYAVGFPAKDGYLMKRTDGILTKAAQQGDGPAYIRDVDAYRERLAYSIRRDPMLSQRALGFGRAWLDWLLSLGGPGDVWTSFFVGWTMREFNTGADSALGMQLPVTLYDFAKLKSDVGLAVTGFVTQIVQLVTIVISAVTGSYGGVAEGVTNFGATAVQLGETGYARHKVRVFRNPFLRWFANPELNLSTNNPSTDAMVRRLFQSSLPNYQRQLGIDFGLAPDAPPRPPPPPEPPLVLPDYRQGPPPSTSKAPEWTKYAVVGGMALGAVALFRFLRR
jgi:hypothetical protein